MKIEKLSISGFRGATKPTDIDFDTSKPVTLIFGENGTGKSTISDAVDFICNRRFGSLEDRSTGGQSKTFIPALGLKISDVKVTLSSKDKTGKPQVWQATLVKDGASVTPAGCPDARILRRSNILKLVNSQPKNRFEELKGFIAVPGIEKSEEALRQAVRDAQSTLTEAIKEHQQATDQLETLWIAEGKKGASSVGWADSEAKKDVTKLNSAVAEATGILSASISANEALGRHDNAVTEKKKAEGVYAAAQADQQKAEKAEAEQNAILIRLLEDAKLYVTGSKDLAACPVCEQPVESDKLLARLNQRIGAMNDLSTLIKATTSAKDKLTAASTLADQSQKTLCEQVKILGLALESCSLAEVSAGKIKWDDFKEALEYQTHSDAVEQNARKLLAAYAPLHNNVKARKDADGKSISQQNAITGLLGTINTKSAAQQSLDALLKQLKQALAVVEKLRKDYVEGILTTISAEVERLYTKMHPNEGIGKVRFYLKPNAIGSLEFDGQFHSKLDVPPQAYYSESHLDTLGICVFVALAKHFKTDNTILVLDDVVTSVDCNHIDRFMTLVHDEAVHFNQVIVTTHYRPWKDRYKYARGPAAKTQLVELRQWDFGLGIRQDEDVTAVKELKACLAAGKLDRQAVASKAGIQLEGILDYLTYQYRCKMPRQTEPNFTLGDLAAGIDGKLGKLLKTAHNLAGLPKKETELKTLIDDLTSRTWVRNQVGCHFSDGGSGITDAEVKDFGTKVLALAELLICDKCEAFPTSKKSGSYWECGCGRVELYPLISPAVPLGTVA